MMHDLALGIDIGGTNTKYGLVDRSGHIINKGSIPTTGHGSVEDFVATLASVLRPLLQEVADRKVVGVGIGAPNGNYFSGEIKFAPNLPWHGVIPLAKLIGDVLGLKATLTNDANAAAIGEMQYGAAKGMRDFIVVTLGTGVGSGFVANGSLIYGHDGFAGELGHVIAIRNGRRCGCGRLGCLEAYTSATGVVHTAHEWLETDERPSTMRPLGDKLTAKNIQEAAAAGDELALEIFEYTGQILGQTLADAVAITSPEAIIFFGGLAHAGDLLLRHVKHYLEANLLNIYQNKIQILPSLLPDSDAAILGSSAMAW